MNAEEEDDLLTEDELILKARSGDEAAFKELVETHQDRIFNTAIGFLHNREDAEDIAQEVFMAVHQSIGGFHGTSKLSTWLYRITVTKSLDFLRRKKRKKRFAVILRLGDLQDDKPGYEPADFIHPGITFENQERAAVLFKAIDRLPDHQKTAFTLCHVEGLSYQETSEVMRVSISSVESLLFRARQNLREYLRAYYTHER